MRNSRGRIARRARARLAVVVEVVGRAGRQTDRSSRAKRLMLATTPPLLPTGVRLSTVVTANERTSAAAKRFGEGGKQKSWRERETFLAVVKDAGLGSFSKFFAVIA
jgi:hypothetical protein